MRLVLAFAGLLFAMLALPQGAAAKVDIQVDLATQTMTVRSDSGENYVWPISSARAGYVTPRGVYRPTSLQTMHYSRKYDNSPMPHSIFFRGGYAIHGTNDARNLGRPASHGCVRLSKANAAKLFAMVRAEGAVIAINGTPPRSTMLASAKKRSTVARAKTVEPSMGSVLGFAPAPATAPSLRDWSKNPGAPFLLR
ncbi:MAG: L,D-transpeptidase [Alsobacter sp.]